MTPEEQLHFYKLSMWLEASKETKHMIGAPQPPEFDRHNEEVMAKYAKLIADFKPTPCPHKKATHVS
jgi:hypothetical protein